MILATIRLAAIAADTTNAFEEVGRVKELSASSIVVVKWVRKLRISVRICLLSNAGMIISCFETSKLDSMLQL